MFNADGTEALTRFWNCFHAKDHTSAAGAIAELLAPTLTQEVSGTLGRAVRQWH